MGELNTGDLHGLVRVEAADVAPGGLDGRVDEVDMLVGGGRDRHRLARGGLGDPRDGQAAEVVVKGPGYKPVVGLVGVECSGVAGSQLQGGGRLPLLPEAMQARQLVHPASHAQLVEQAARAHCLDL
jgi:hypothetical protein